MEPSEAVSTPNHSENTTSGSQSSQLHSSVLDPAPFDAQYVATDDPIHAELQKLDLKDEKEEVVKDYDEGGEWEGETNPGEGEGDGEGNATQKIDESDRDRSIKNDDDDEEVDAGDGDGSEVEKRRERWGKNNHQYPVRPEAEDCAFYLKTGTCKFGSFCKFNHPVRKRNQVCF